MDYKKCADEIIAKVGGSDNVDTVTHCATRLRFIIKDNSAVDQEAIKKIEGVYGVVNASGQLQVVLAGNLIPVFNEITKNYHFKVGEVVDENLDADIGKTGGKKTVKSVLKSALGVLVASVTPVIPGLIAGGMIKVFLVVATLINADFASSQTYALLSLLGNAVFYFLPFFIAYGTAKKLGGNIIYAMILAAALVSPSFVEMVSEGDAIHIFGLPVALVNYNSSLFPALFGAVAVTYFEKLFDKIIPGMFKIIFVGALTLICSYVVTVVIFGPLGTYLGQYVVAFLNWLHKVAGPFANAVMTAVAPFLVMTGMHTLLPPFMVQAFATQGYDNFFRPSLLLYNIAIGGACIGMALKVRDKKVRAEAASCGLSAVLGVSEPALFGFAIPNKNTLLSTVIGGFCGGFVCGLTGATAYSMGYSSLLALPIFEKTMPQMAIAICVAFFVSLAVSFITNKKQTA